MTLQQLEYITAVDRHRHFAKAATACGVTQSTLSSMVQKLEAELDVTIFDRNAHPVAPTAMGAEIIRRAKVLLYQSGQLHEFVRSTREEEGGTLRLGMASTVAPYVLPQLLCSLSREHPTVALSVEEARLTALHEKLVRGELDVALVPGPVEHEEILEIPLYHEDFVAYVSPADPLFSLNELSASNLPPERVWVLRDGYCPRNGNYPFCQCQGGNRAIYEAGSIETLLRIVDHCGGYTIIPQLHLPLLSPERLGRIRHLAHPAPGREICFAVRRDFVRERLLNILADTLKKIVPEEMIVERMRKFKIKI